MKREILFRGKRVDNGEWVEGDLVQQYWLEEDYFMTCAIRYKIGVLYSFPIEVHPETVGQFCGLIDKNGNKIFEGDVVCSESHNPKNYEVRFVEGGFAAFNGDLYPIDINHFYPSIGCEIEIIGNIYDNPELITNKQTHSKQVTDLGAKEVIHCPTEREAVAICQLMHDVGLRWCTGRLYVDEHRRWDEYGNLTCYNPKDGRYADMYFYKGQGYIIHPASDFLPADFYKDSEL